MIKLRILSEAVQDLANALQFYETQSPGLGDDFLFEYERALLRIRSFPEAWAPVSTHLRRCLLRRFPYAVFYTKEGTDIVISAVSDLRRNPEKLPQQPTP